MSNTKTTDPATEATVSTTTLDPASLEDAFANAYAEAERKRRELREQVAHFAEVAEEAEDFAAEVTGGLRAGREEFTAYDLAASRVAVERAKILHDGAVVRLSRAVKAGPHKPTAAAEIVSKINGVLGLNVVLVPSIPSDPLEGRAAFMVQTEAASPVDGSGAIVSRGIRLVSYRDEHFKPMSTEAIRQALDPNDRGDVKTMGRGSIEKDGRGRDELVIDVNYLMPTVGLPTLDAGGSGATTVAGSSAASAGSAIGGRAEALMGKTKVPRFIFSGPGYKEFETVEVFTASSSCKVISSSRKRDGERIVTTVTVGVSLRPANDAIRIPSEKYKAALTEAGEAIKGQSIGWLGKVTEVSERGANALPTGGSYAEFTVALEAIAA